MTSFETVRRSIGLMQASMLLASSLLIGLLLSAAQIYTAYQQQQLDFREKAENIVNLSVGGATNAAWALDTRLAGEVLQGAINQSGVTHVEIRARLSNAEEQVLASLDSDPRVYGWLAEWVARSFFDHQSRLVTPLHIDKQKPMSEVGALLITFDPRHEAQKFVATAMTSLAVTLLEALLIGLVLFFIGQWFITLPIRRAAAAIERVEPEELQNDVHKVPVPSLHKDDELGQLLNHTNELLVRLGISQSKLLDLATRDPLTGLANRTLIQEFLAKMLSAAQRASRMVAVTFIDLDRFKNINDTLGHEMGDKVLKHVANALLQQIRDQDAVGRLGGDEFLLVTPIKSINDVILMVERILHVLDRPVRIEGYDLKIHVSLGIALYPNDGEDADTLMRCADLAMYKAKEQKSSQWHLFSEEMKQKVEEGLALETALAHAIKNAELEIFLQPLFGATTMRLETCEALLRWKRDGRYVDTSKFIEVAELTGLIGEIGEWVTNEACCLIRAWGEQAIPISVNVSGQQLADERFVARMIEIVDGFSIPPRLIEFEITETMLMHNLEQSFDRLSRLRERGFRVVIDDFGTGYSSLSYLSQLPIDALKIDRSFVSGSEQSSVVLNAIIALGKALGIRVVAEGIETDAQRDALIDSGCDCLQGYLLGRPMPVRQFEAALLQRSDDAHARRQ